MSKGRPTFAEGVIPPQMVWKQRGGRGPRGFVRVPERRFRCGVSWSDALYCWVATRPEDGSTKRLFRTKEEAIAQREAWEREAGYSALLTD
jgi:hypothetical protein